MRRAGGFLASVAAATIVGVTERSESARRLGRSKPVRVFVGFAPGGNSDLVARLIAQWLSERLGQPFVVENRAGANGTLAAEATARAAADGYTLFMAALPHLAIAPAMGKLGYDPVKDFTPISNVGTNPFVLVVHPSFPAGTLKEFEDQVRRQPGKIPYASGGIGSLTHLSMALYLKRAGLDMIHVPYKGGGPASTDVLAGHVKVYFSNLSAIAAHVQGGALRALAISDDKRHAAVARCPDHERTRLPGLPHAHLERAGGARRRRQRTSSNGWPARSRSRSRTSRSASASSAMASIRSATGPKSLPRPSRPTSRSGPKP